MNAKRQTIWLVSMLSLMVVLSAYYLFTDNVGEMNVASENNENQSYTKIDEVGLDGEAILDRLVGGSVDHSSDSQVLQKVQAGAQSGQDYFALLEMKRNETLTMEIERLFDIAMDPQQTTEEIVKAEERVRAIEEMQAKLYDLEDQLMRDFENVVIAEDNGIWKVVVQADKLERSQAVSIIDMVITNLQVAPGKIAVQFVQ